MSPVHEVSTTDVLDKEDKKDICFGGQRKKRKWTVLILRHEGLILPVLEGDTDSRSRQGRERIKMLVDLMGEWTYDDLKQIGRTY